MCRLTFIKCSEEATNRELQGLMPDKQKQLHTQYKFYLYNAKSKQQLPQCYCIVK